MSAFLRAAFRRSDNLSSFLSENFLKIVSLVLTILVILGSIVQFQTFSIQVHGKQLDRQYLMFGQYIAGASFITDDSAGYRKGVLSSEKLNKLNADLFDKSFDFQMKKYYVEIGSYDGTARWAFGDNSILRENYKAREYPAAINMSDTIVPGNITLYVPRVE